MCFDRIEGGRKPACVQACTTEALDFGARDEIVRKARLRAKAIGGYVYGDESEDVATSTIYVSDVPFEELGFPTLEQRTPTPKAFRNLLPTRLAEASFGAIVMAVLGFVIWRRWTIAKAKLEAVPGKVKKEE
jgi:formate dehydrogenase iron-sulfur subunit